MSMNDAAAQRCSERTFKTRIHSFAGILASLFVVAFMRARMMQEALELRADPLAIRPYHPYVPARPRRLFGIVILLVTTCVVGWIV